MEGVQEAFISTFEETAFQFLNPLEKPVQEYDDIGYFIGRCRFDGAINGIFDLIIHESTVNEYLEFLFSDEPETEITDELRSDSVKELSNVLCGNMISKCVNAQASEYKIEKPVILALSSLADAGDLSLYSFFENSGKVCGFSFLVN